MHKVRPSSHRSHPQRHQRRTDGTAGPDTEKQRTEEEDHERRPPENRGENQRTEEENQRTEEEDQESRPPENGGGGPDEKNRRTEENRRTADRFCVPQRTGEPEVNVLTRSRRLTAAEQHTNRRVKNESENESENSGLNGFIEETTSESVCGGREHLHLKERRVLCNTQEQTAGQTLDPVTGLNS